ncbi:SDR family oxidoreductase [Vibrio splendidus]
MDMKGKIIVTGGSHGVGLATIQLLNEKGYIAINLDLAGDPSIDVTNHQQVKQYLSAHDDSIGLICCASLANSALIENMDMKIANEVIQTNLFGALNSVNSVFKDFKESSEPRSIVLLSSIWALTGQPGLTAFSASQFGLRGLAQSLHMEGLSHNVFTTALCMTYVSTNKMKVIPDEIKDKMIASECPTGKMLTPEEAAHWLVYTTEQQLEGKPMDDFTHRSLRHPKQL